MTNVLNHIQSEATITQLNNGIILTDVQCAGTNIGSSATLNISPSGFDRIIVVAHWVDASNFCLQIPTGSLVSPTAWEIYTDAPTGDSITVFFQPSFDSLLDGTTSFTLTNSNGKLLRPVFTSGGLTRWGFIT